MQGQTISPEEQAKIDAILARETARAAPTPAVATDEQAKIDAILKRDKERAAASVTTGEKIAQVPGSMARGVGTSFTSTASGLESFFDAIVAPFTGQSKADLVASAASSQRRAEELNKSLPKPDPRLEGSLWQTIPEAGGSAAFFGGSALVAGPQSALSAGMVAGGLGSASQFSSGYYDALGETGDPEIAFEAALKNAPIGLLEGIPLGGQVARVLGRVNKSTGGGLVKLLVRAASEGGEEAAQELVASGWQDLVAKHIMAYDEDRKILEGALTTDALPGFVVGAVLGAASTGVEQKRAAGEQPQAQAKTEAQQAADAWTAPVEAQPEPRPIEEVGGPQPIEVVGAAPGTPWQQGAQGQAGIPAAQTPTMPAEAPASEPQELKHRDKEILGLVREKWSGLPYEVARAVSADVGGVVVGAPTRLDDVITGEQRSPDEFNTNAKQVYDSFSDVRGAIREKYGSTVRLWRAQGSGEHGQLADYALKAGRRKAVLNYATKEEASKYLTEGRELVYRDVPVDEIVAVQNPTERGLYEEFIVLHPDATEADRRNLGLVASQDAAGSTQTPSLASEVTPTPEAILEAPTQPSEEQVKKPLDRAAIEQRDRRYMESVSSGDAEAAQKLVDEAAAESGYNVLPVYHGVASGQFDGDTFDPSRLGENTGTESSKMGFFFAASENTANSYGKNVLTEAAQSAIDTLAGTVGKGRNRTLDSAIDRIGMLLRAGQSEPSASVDSAYKAAMSALDSEERAASAGPQRLYGEAVQSIQAKREALEKARSDFSSVMSERGGKDAVSVRAALKMNRPYIIDAMGRDIKMAKVLAVAKKRGYDGVIVRNVFDGTAFSDDVYVVFEAGQIKVADPVVRDSSGRAKTLSERFQTAGSPTAASQKAQSAQPVVEPTTAPTEVAEPESPVPLPSEAAEVPPEARPEVSQPEPNDTVGIAAVKVQEMAAKYGFQPPPAKEAEAFKGWMEEAKAIYDSTPERVGSLIAEAEDKPRALEPKEYVLLGLAQTARANVLDAAYDRYNLESTPENLEALQREQRLTEEFNDSVAKAKSASGTSLRSIAVLINRDFSLAGMLKRRLASEGGESNLLRQEGGAEKITKIREEVRKEYEVIAKAEKDLAVEQAKAESADRISQLEKQVEGLRKRLKSEAKGPKPPSRQQAIQKSQKRISELIKELSVVARQANVGAPLDPKVLKIALDLAVESIKVGAMSFQQWADTIRQHVKADDATLTKVWDDANKASRAELLDTLKSKVSEGRKPSSLRGDFLAIEEDIIRSNMEITSEAIVDEVFAVVKEAMPSITREDVMDIIANRDNFKALPDDAVKRKRMQVNSEVQTDRKLLDVARKQIPKMNGFERMPPSDSNRRKTQQLNENLKALHEEMRRLGIEPEKEYNLKSARDAIKTRLRNSISDRKSELERGERNVKERRTVEDDEAMKELRAQLAEVETLYDEMFAQEIRVDQLNREIASIDKRLADGGRTEVEGVMQGPPASPEVAERERLLLEKKAELKAMRDADVARAEKSAEQALRRSIQRTEARLRGQEAKPSSKAKPDSPLLRAMRSELTSLKAELDALPSTQKAKEEALIAASIARKEKVLSDLDRSTIMQDLTGELTERQKRGQRKPSAPEVKLISQIEQAKTRNLGSSAHIHWKRASKLRKGLMFAADTPDVLRSLRTAYDFSVVMVQLGKVTLGHPIKATRSWIPTMLKAAKSEEFFQELDASIRNRPLAPVSDKAKLQLTDIDGERSKREELAAAKLLEYIPGIAGHGIRGSNRAFVAYMNLVRAETFDSMYRAKPGLVTDDEAMRLARFVNVFSGRGDTESLDEAHTALKSIVSVGAKKSRIATVTANASTPLLWAPRLYLSQVQMILSPLYYAVPGKGKTNFVRKEVAKQIARWIAAEVAIISLVNLYKHMNDDDEISVETDPRSSDFMKIRIKEKRYDTFGGLSQFVVLLTRLASGEKKDLEGKLSDIRGEKARSGHDGADVAARFARGKLTPFASMLVDYLLSGKNVVGQTRDFKNIYRDPPKFAAEVLVNYVGPMLAISVYQSLRDEGFTKGAIESILSAIGTSIQNYDN